VFPEVHQRVAWETEGLLISCWLALQDDVEDVEYKPFWKYRLERENGGRIMSISCRYGGSAGEPA
jgi:hypothetical protein